MNEKIVLNEKQKKLVEENLSVVHIVINKYMVGIQGNNVAPNYSREDAIQDGYVALCKAAFKFDGDKNVPFAGYANTVVHNYVYSQIQRHFRRKEVPLEDVLSAYTGEVCEELYRCESNELTVKINQLINERKNVYNARFPYAYDIFIMRTIHGIKNKDIAHLLKIDTSDVSYKYTLAKADVKRCVLAAKIAG